jgi:hypothetical protein
MSYHDLSDDEIVELVTEHLVQDGHIRIEYIKIECLDGNLHLAGRVGSEEELQAIEEILGDVLDLPSYENSVWVDDSLAFQSDDSSKGTDASSHDEESESETDSIFEPDDEDDEDDEE